MTTSLGPAARVSQAELRLCEAAQELDRKNQEFAEATPEQKRVLIAKDVLEWLGEGKILPRNGTYLSPLNSLGVDMSKEPDRVDGGKCTACALGAVFACTVERTGGLAGFWGHNRQSDMTTELAPYFDRHQLRLIESAFEQADFTAGTTKDEAMRAMKFEPFRWAAKDRMRLIMANIIANGGTFVP